MERVEARIVNSKQPLFGVTYPNRVYYSSFGDTDNADDNVLSYGEDIQDQKGVEVNQAYIEALDKYIGAKVFVPVKDFIPFLAQVQRRKQDELGNIIDKEHINPILNTRVY